MHGRIFKGSCNQKALQLLITTLLVSSLLFMPSVGRRIHPAATHAADGISPNESSIPASTPTKWWVRTPALITPALPGGTGHGYARGEINDCPQILSSPLHTEAYAYISIDSPLPNRLRTGAGRAAPQLGQIQPGAVVRIIDGPLCADGFSWWLVEIVDSDLRGWTAAGSKSEQWVLPCPNPAAACKMSPEIQQAAPTTAHSSKQGNNDHTCTSNRIFIGLPTQVKEDDLLVVRSEPHTGHAVGHAGPLSAVTIVDGPACAGGAVWWEVNIPSLNLAGWAAEASLRPCRQEDDCT
jgi:hypothetical protein